MDGCERKELTTIHLNQHDRVRSVYPGGMAFEVAFCHQTIDLAKINAVWARLKPVVLAHNGSDVATQFENSLDKQQAALDKEDASALRTEANNALALVDKLEMLF